MRSEEEMSWKNSSKDKKEVKDDMLADNAGNGRKLKETAAFFSWRRIAL